MSEKTTICFKQRYHYKRMSACMETQNGVKCPVNWLFGKYERSRTRLIKYAHEVLLSFLMHVVCS